MHKKWRAEGGIQDGGVGNEKWDLGGGGARGGGVERGGERAVERSGVGGKRGRVM